MESKKARGVSAKKATEPKVAKKGMGIKAIFTALKGTLPGRIMAVMQSGEFAKTAEKMEPGFIDTGKKVNAYELACLTVQLDCEKELKQLVMQIDPLTMHMASRGIFPDKDPEKLEKVKRISYLQADIGILKKLFNNSVLPRIDEQGLVNIFDGDKIALMKLEYHNNPSGELVDRGDSIANLCEFLEMIGSLAPEATNSGEQNNNLFKNLFPEGGYDLLRMIKSMPAQTCGGGRLRDFPLPPRKKF